MKAIWNNKVIASSDEVLVCDGNYYFPPSSIDCTYFNVSDTHTACFKKGKANFYNVTVSGQTNIDAAWYYPDPKPEAIHIQNYIAFWKGIHIEK